MLAQFARGQIDKSGRNCRHCLKRLTDWGLHKTDFFDQKIKIRGAEGRMSEAAIELTGIDKRFGAVHANRSINLKVESGTIHGIIGENGAGKSTLMSILYGFYQADSGDIAIKGKKTVIHTPNDAIAAGPVRR